MKRFILIPFLALAFTACQEGLIQPPDETEPGSQLSETSTGVVDAAPGMTMAQSQLMPGWEMEELVPPETGRWYGDLAFAPDGDLIYSVGAASRLPCDSYIGQVSPDGIVGVFATPCIDHPSSLAFPPWSGSTLIMIEGAGYCDTIYEVPPGTGPGLAQVFLECSVIVNRDIAVHPATADLYVADVYASVVRRITSGGSMTIVSEIPRLWDHETLRLEFLSSGRLFLAHRGTGKIYEVSLSGGGLMDYSSAFAQPVAMAVDQDDNLWVGHQTGEDYSIEILHGDGRIDTWATGLPEIGRLVFGPDGDLYGIVGGTIVRFRQSNVPPVADAGSDQMAVRTSASGAEVTLDGSASYDDDNNIAAYEWFLAGSPVATGVSATLLLPLGEHLITLRVTDEAGEAAEDQVVVEVLNAAPTAVTAGSMNLIITEVGRFDATASYDVDGSIVNFGWDFGDGYQASGPFANHAYAGEGSYTGTVTVVDNDGASSTASIRVTVKTYGDATGDVVDAVEKLVANGDLKREDATGLVEKLGQAIDHFDAGRNRPAVRKLGDFIDQVNALVRSKRMDPEDAAVLIDDAKRIIDVAEA